MSPERRLLKFLGLLALIALGSGGCDAEEDAGGPGPDVVTAMRQHCDSTEGRWRPGALACICAGRQLFDPDAGCVPVSIYPHGNGHPTERLGSKGALSVAVMKGSGVTDADIEDEEMLWDEFTGRAVSRRDPSLNLFAFRDMTAGVYHMGLGQLSRYAWSNPPLQHFDRPKRSIPSLNVETFALACERALQNDTEKSDPSLPKEVIAHLCVSLVKGWRYLGDDAAGEDKKAIPSFSDEGDNCAHSCAVSTLSSYAGYAYRTSITMRHLVPVARSVSAWAPDGGAAVAYLSPKLGLQALEWRHVTTVHETNEVSLEYGLFDGALNSLERAASIIESNQCREAMIQARSQSPIRQEGELRVMLLEDDLRCGATYLARSYDGSSSMWSSEGHSDDVTTPCADADAALFCEGDSLTGNEDDHGADMAEVVLGNDPGLRFATLSKRDLVTRGPEQAVAAWREALVSYAPQVVNISQVFARLIPDCAAAFGPIFEEFRDILFVVGAGNSGMSNGINLCPVSLAASYPNVVTVAAYGEDGSLVATSNRGAAVAMVAAPADGIVRRGNDISHGITVSGTSVAAAHVSHWALRELQRRPKTRPEELLTNLMASCGADGLDVACGGRAL